MLEGEVRVTPDGEEPVKFGPGDLVVFPTGMYLYTRQCLSIIDLVVNPDTHHLIEFKILMIYKLMHYQGD